MTSPDVLVIGAGMRAVGRFPYLHDALPRISTRLISKLLLQSPSGETASLESPAPAALMIRRARAGHSAPPW